MKPNYSLMVLGAFALFVNACGNSGDGLSTGAGGAKGLGGVRSSGGSPGMGGAASGAGGRGSGAPGGSTGLTGAVTGGGGVAGGGVTGGGGRTTGAGGVSGNGGAGGSLCPSFQLAAPGPDSPRDVFVVLDRSATMADDANGTSCSGGCGGNSKWSLLVSALESIVAANPQVNWGITFYGGDDVCSGSAGVPVEVGPQTLNAIETAIAGRPPGGSNNAAATPEIFSASNYLAALPDLGPRYIMFVTDGREGCSTDSSPFDTTYLEEALTSGRVAGFPTFVVGPPAGSNAASIAALNDLATNGGLPNPGATSYYPPSDLPAALSQIAQGEGTPCRIPLSIAIDYYGTALRSVILTRLDGTMVNVAQDATAGWSVPSFYYADSLPTLIDLNGELCQEFKAGAFRTVTITYNCTAP